MGYQMFHKVEGHKIDGLEGPFRYITGKVLYYDPQEGQYYDATCDMYVTDEDMAYHLGHKVQKFS